MYDQSGRYPMAVGADGRAFVFCRTGGREAKLFVEGRASSLVTVSGYAVLPGLATSATAASAVILNDDVRV